MRKLFMVIKQEFRMTAANKVFIIITIIGPFLILAVSVLPGLFAGSSTSVPEDTTVAVVGVSSSEFSEISSALQQSRIKAVRKTDPESAKTAVLEGRYKGMLTLPSDYVDANQYHYYSKTGTDIIVTETLQAVIGHMVITKRLAREGIDPSRVSALTARPQISVHKIETESGGRGQDFFSVFSTAMAFVMLLYMTVLLYGQMIGRSVITEKTSKTVEIMLSSVRPVQLLFGKILGKCLAGLLQYGIWIGVALVLAYIIGPSLNIQIPASLTLFNLLFLIIFFILAFFLYSAAYAALGAGAEDEQHLGQLAWPLILFLVLPLITMSGFIMNPGSTLAAVLSYFPMTAPIVMLIRVILDTPPAWEVFLSILLLLATITGFIFLSSKIFKVGILMTGKRFSIKEILRWVHY
jgi:ABC-2 type transport system permease protein